MKFAVAVLLGFASVSQGIKWRPNPAQSPWAAKPEEPKKTKISDGFSAHRDYSIDSGVNYERAIPAMYDTEADDRLMHSLIKNYATEGKGEDGLPNGKFYLTKADAMLAAGEVANTHLGLTGDALSSFVETTGAKAYNTVDNLNEGFIDIVKGPVFLRYVTDEVEVSNGLQVQLDSQMDMGHQFRPLNTIQQPWSAKPSEAPTGPLVGAYPSNYGGPEVYERVIPSRFTEEADDRLMNSLISKYALEGKTDGSPNGKFYLDKAGAFAVANEVVGTHLGFTGEKKESFLAGKFDQLWNHYDVIGQGWLAVEKGAPFVRQILGENELSNGLQLQVQSDNI